MKLYNKYFIFSIVMVMMIFAMTGCQNNNELGELKENDLLKTVDGICDDYYMQKEFVGMSVAVIKDGKVSYLNYGNVKEDGEETTENTIYEIASISKTFAGTLLAQETIKGKVALDDPVQNYIKYPISNEYNGKTMTLENLATHTSGFPRMPNNWRTGPNPYKNYDREKLDKYLKKFVLERKPGAYYEYSNLSFGLLGCILEDVENKTYEELLQENITNQLDMKSTKIFLDEELQAKKAFPYATKDIEGYEWDFDALQACAGMKSTTRDLSRYIAANMNQLECSDELKQSFDIAQDIHYKGNMTIGLAWRFVNVGNKTILEHDGLAAGYTSYAAFNKDEGVGVVVLCNSTDGVIPLGQTIMDKLLKSK
ncbi:beta-lactamase family protein [Sedimentibacter sp. zth1]|uniref:serine hydrolase domain-containing protein n=1 Tax=Sedimentibacter sp. zth1 TaxID=2816908 RepID=UPI001A931E86|nr:serine hydrolase domain-containing protein [Sedimentibacter sp. zth1]QSX06167.1 beta-lactamase family protein [Sedimentibacter sp. zth1]